MCVHNMSYDIPLVIMSVSLKLISLITFCLFREIIFPQKNTGENYLFEKITIIMTERTTSESTSSCVVLIDLFFFLNKLP